MTDIKNLTEKMLNKRFPEQDKAGDCLFELGIKPTGAAMLAFAMIRKAASGDVSAAKLVLDLIKDTPDTDEAVDWSQLSDAELRRMLENG